MSGAPDRTAPRSAGAEPRDGRRRRGDRRRATVTAATLRVVERDGVAGVTHRAVARAAAVPASSVAYYYATLDDLLVAALTAAAEGYARQLDDLVARGDEIGGLAALIADGGGGPGRERAIAERELTLLAARRPALRPIARHWQDLVTRVARHHSDDPRTVETTVAVADGICTRVLLGDEPVTAEEVRTLLHHALGLD